MHCSLVQGDPLEYKKYGRMTFKKNIKMEGRYDNFKDLPYTWQFKQMWPGSQKGNKYIRYQNVNFIVNFSKTIPFSVVCFCVINHFFFHVREFRFTSEVPIRLDYHGKHVSMDQVCSRLLCCQIYNLPFLYSFFSSKRFFVLCHQFDLCIFWKYFNYI